MHNDRRNALSLLKLRLSTTASGRFVARVRALSELGPHARNVASLAGSAVHDVAPRGVLSPGEERRGLVQHDGTVVAYGDLAGGDLDVRPPSAGVAVVQQIGLKTRDWATLLKRVWEFDALTCTGCGGRMRFIAVIKDRAVIERILKHSGEDARGRWFARARAPATRGREGRGARGGRIVWEGDVRAESGGGWIRSAWQWSRRHVFRRRCERAPRENAITSHTGRSRTLPERQSALSDHLAKARRRETSLAEV
jgi:hypothetical protein